MTRTFLENMQRHMRLSILRTLAELSQYRANDSILRDSLSQYGFDASRDQVRGELHWLAEAGMVELTESGKMIVAKATGRGCDVAAGRSLHPDIQRPGP